MRVDRRTVHGRRLCVIMPRVVHCPRGWHRVRPRRRLGATSDNSPSVLIPRRHERAALDAVERVPGECIYVEADESQAASIIDDDISTLKSSTDGELSGPRRTSLAPWLADVQRPPTVDPGFTVFEPHRQRRLDQVTSLAGSAGEEWRRMPAPLAPEICDVDMPSARRRASRGRRTTARSRSYSTRSTSSHRLNRRRRNATSCPSRRLGTISGSRSPQHRVRTLVVGGCGEETSLAARDR